jgi:hypothetical protein
MRRLIAVIIVSGLVACGVLLHAQTSTFLEGTAQCRAVSVWFADGYSRGPFKNQATVQPMLVLFAEVPQTAMVTLHRTAGGPLVHAVAVDAQRRTVVDLYELLGRTDATFSVDVRFDGIGAADLKMWTNGIGTSSQGLALCR